MGGSKLGFRQLFVETAVIMVLAILVPSVVLFDFSVLVNELGESSITEITQEVIVFLCLALMLWRARQSDAAAARPAFILAAGFFASLFIREFDFLFDRTPVSWVWPVGAVVVFCLYQAWNEKSKTAASLMQFANSRPYVYFLVGVVMLVIFNRLFGSGGFLWKSVMGDAYTHVFKTVIQEGLELFAYALMGFGILSSKASDWVPKNS